jgi:hypothetical protein
MKVARGAARALTRRVPLTKFVSARLPNFDSRAPRKI